MDVLSTLQLVDVDKVCLHEEHEHVRLRKTCMRIASDGVLRHPPIAMKMTDGRYLILDGAHRTYALKDLGCQRIPVQVVRPDEVDFYAWSHLIEAGAWLDQLKSEPAICWHSECDKSNPIAELATETENYYLYAKNNEKGLLSARVEAWHSVVNTYRKDYPVQRIASEQHQQVPHGMVMLRYPISTLQELEEIVLSGMVMPAGVTRVLVNGRLLNLNIPLEFLTNRSFDQEAWMRQKEKWSQSLRLYAEAVYLCEV